VNVLVDARNVLRSQWPNMREEELLERCESYRALATKGMPESVFLTRKDPAAGTEVGAGL